LFITKFTIHFQDNQPQPVICVRTQSAIFHGVIFIGNEFA